ncbi:MAG: BTB/POZ domain-containing protein [archaeon]|nr:BTB/POZ domain-containing protein [archaeon]
MFRRSKKGQPKSPDPSEATCCSSSSFLPGEPALPDLRPPNKITDGLQLEDFVADPGDWMGSLMEDPMLADRRVNGLTVVHFLCLKRDTTRLYQLLSALEAMRHAAEQGFRFDINKATWAPSEPLYHQCTALHCAVMDAEPVCLSMISLLCQHGADPTISSGLGLLPSAVLLRCHPSPKPSATLLDLLQAPESSSFGSFTDSVFIGCLDRKGFVGAVDRDGRTVLHEMLARCFEVGQSMPLFLKAFARLEECAEQDVRFALATSLRHHSERTDKFAKMRESADVGAAEITVGFGTGIELIWHDSASSSTQDQSNNLDDDSPDRSLRSPSSNPRFSSSSARQRASSPSLLTPSSTTIKEIDLPPPCSNQLPAQWTYLSNHFFEDWPVFGTPDADAAEVGWILQRQGFVVSELTTVGTAQWVRLSVQQDSGEPLSGWAQTERNGVSCLVPVSSSLLHKPSPDALRDKLFAMVTRRTQLGESILDVLLGRLVSPKHDCPWTTNFLIPLFRFLTCDHHFFGLSSPAHSGAQMNDSNDAPHHVLGWILLHLDHPCVRMLWNHIQDMLTVSLLRAHAAPGRFPIAIAFQKAPDTCSSIIDMGGWVDCRVADATPLLNLILASSDSAPLIHRALKATTYLAQQDASGGNIWHSVAFNTALKEPEMAVLCECINASLGDDASNTILASRNVKGLLPLDIGLRENNQSFLRWMVLGGRVEEEALPRVLRKFVLSGINDNLHPSNRVGALLCSSAQSDMLFCRSRNEDVLCSSQAQCCACSGMSRLLLSPKSGWWAPVSLSIKHPIAALLDSPVKSDIRLIVARPEDPGSAPMVVHAHRVILSRCSYFRSLFRSRMQEANSGTIHVDCSPICLFTCLYHLYDARISPSFECRDSVSYLTIPLPEGVSMGEQGQTKASTAKIARFFEELFEITSMWALPSLLENLEVELLFWIQTSDPANIGLAELFSLFDLSILLPQAFRQGPNLQRMIVEMIRSPRLSHQVEQAAELELCAAALVAFVSIQSQSINGWKPTAPLHGPSAVGSSSASGHFDESNQNLGQQIFF